MKRRIIILVSFMLAIAQVNAQCPQFYNFYGVASNAPYWYSCSGNNFNLNIQSPNSVGPYTIDWGDGSPISIGSVWDPPTSVTHLYTATVDTFIVEITQASTGCVIQGVVVMEEASSASIQIPIGGLTQACAPQDMEFINSSTNVSENTMFIWDFGDGSPPLTFDYTNWNQTITHTYQENTVDCETVVTLAAGNYCNTVQGGNSTATFNPIRIWDYDIAAITPSDYVLCWPDNTVTYVNTTEKNCYFQGNIAQRYEYWNLGDYWGQGTDSIIDWTPWPPSFPQTVSYPGIGSYTVMMLDSNFCGIDTAYVTINIVPPPTAGITAADDTICAGESITFLNASSAEANAWLINYGDGSGWGNMGSNSANHTFNTLGDYSVGLVAYVSGAGASCTDTAWVDVRVQPRPNAAFTLSDLEECDSLNYSVVESSISAISWNWNMGNGNTYAIQNPPDQNYPNVGSYNVSLTVIAANGCTDNTIQQVNVYESPVADFSTLDVCVGETAQFFDESSSNSADTVVAWNWDFGDSGTSVLQAPAHYYSASGSYNVTLQVTTAHCQADTLIQIVVETPPITDFTANQTSVCSPLSVDFTNASSGAVTYSWDFGDGNSSSLTDVSHIFTNNSLASAVYTVVLTSSNAFGCSSNDSLDITVYGLTNASFTSDATPSCAPDEVNFINTSTGASGYQWNFGDGSLLATVVSPSHIFYNNTAFIQYYTTQLVAFSSNGCHDTTFQTITSYPEPDFQFDVSGQSGCIPLSVNFPTIAGAVIYQWTFGDGYTATGPAPVHVYQNLTDTVQQYPVMLIASNPFGCVDTSFSSIQVYPKPVAQFSAIPSTGCSPLAVTLNNSSSLAQSNQWIYGTGDTLQLNDPSHGFTYVNTSAAPLAYTLRLIVTSAEGCTSTVTRPINVYPEVHAQFNMSPEGCSPLSVVFDNNTTGASSHLWNFGDGFQGITHSPTHTYYNLGQADSLFNVQLTSTSQYGCTDTDMDTVVVHPLPVADFTLSEIEGCSPLTVNITDMSTGGGTYAWTYGDGLISYTTALSHDHTYVSSSTIPQELDLNLLLATDFGCTSAETIEITVFPPVNALFQTDEALCATELFTFFNQSIGAATYQWNFGDGTGSSYVNPLHSYSNTSGVSQYFPVTILATSQYACTDIYEDTLTVHSAPIAEIYIDSTSTCHPLYVDFINNSVFADSYIWDYGDGSNSSNGDSIHSHVFTNTSSFLVEYEIEMIAVTDFGCTDTSSTSVHMIPRLESNFAFVDNGCHPYAVDLNNGSEGALNYQWIYSDGSQDTIADPDHIFYNYGITDESFSIMLIANSYFGCADTMTQDIIVYPLPDAEFVVTPVIQVFPNATVEIMDNSVAGTASYTWTFGDGTGADSSVMTGHTYGTWGSYEISLLIDNGHCSDYEVQAIEIQAPQSSADFSGSGDGCAPITIAFENLSEYGSNYLWNFGDGGVSQNNAPTYTYYYPGTYTVSLLVTGPGGNSIAVHDTVVHVYPNATAYFTANPLIVNTGDPVYFYNLSNQANQFQWDFGDGQTSTQLSPVHVFQEIGSYDITLIANNEYNCPDTLTVEDAVLVDAGGYIDFPNAFTPDPLGGANGAYDPNMLNNDVFFPVFDGVEEYQLQIYNRWGELLYESEDIHRGWDGYYRGNLAQQGVYVWRAQVTFTDGKQVIRAGDLTLLR